MLSSLGLPCPVVSIGNLTNGGTGKTPFVEYLSRHYALAHRMPTMILQVRWWWVAVGSWGGAAVEGGAGSFVDRLYQPLALRCPAALLPCCPAALLLGPAARCCRQSHISALHTPHPSPQRGGGTVDETVMMRHLLDGLPVVVSERATTSVEARDYLRWVLGAAPGLQCAVLCGPPAAHIPQAAAVEWWLLWSVVPVRLVPAAA